MTAKENEKVTQEVAAAVETSVVAATAATAANAANAATAVEAGAGAVTETKVKTASDFELTVVVPVFNEEESLPKLFTELSRYAQKSSMKVCFLLVNDGSSDRSLQLIEQQVQNSEIFFYVSLQQRCGLTGALKAGFHCVQTPWAGYIDADLQTFPEDFELLWKMRDQGDLICGIRAKRHDSISKKIQSRLANKIRNAITHDGFSDTNCPLKIIKIELACQLPLFSGMHRFLPALTLLLGKKVASTPVRHQERKSGTSKFNFFNRAFSGAFDLLVFVWMRRRYVAPCIGHNNLEIKEGKRID